MKRIKLIILSIFFSIFLTSCSVVSPFQDVNSDFSEFTRSIYRQEVSSNTIHLHYSLKDPESYGISDAPITFGSFSTDETSGKAYCENLSEAIQEFPYKSLSAENQLTYDLLTYYLDVYKESFSFTYYYEPLTPITGVHAQLPILLSEFPFYDEQDIQEYLSLLEIFPEYFSSLILFENEKVYKDLFMSDSMLEKVIEHCNAFINLGNQNYLYSTFGERLAKCNFLSEEDSNTYQQQNQTLVETCVIPAYENLVKSLEAFRGLGTNENGLCYFPNGKEYYEYLIKSQVGTNRNISEIKKLLQNQITSDFINCQNILSENPSIISEPISIHETPEEILFYLKENIQYHFPESAPVSVEVKYVPSSLKDFLSPAFYLIPPIDDSLENTIYINPSHMTNDVYLFTTLAHEGFPGHLYQTTYFANTNTDPLRTLFSFTGYVEGWATYAEMCSYYISPLEKNHATLLQKNNSMILGLYAFADIGVHYDGWTFQDTLEFFSSYGINDESVIDEIYQLIVGDPANYLSYYLGYLEILELKKDWEGSQLEFHKWLLDMGPVPFAIMQ